MIDPTNLEKARLAWGVDLPDWVRLLATAADRLGQRAAGARIARSGGLVSRIINNSYGALTTEIEQRVSAVFGNSQVACPELGSIPHISCLATRRRKAAPVNAVQRHMADACPLCPLNPDLKKELSQ